MALAAAFGFIDDRWQIRARWQLLEQIAPGGLRHRLGVTIAFVNNPLDFVGGILRPTLASSSTGLAAVLVTALWIVGMINSINFIDGLDGLSTGVALIAALTLGCHLADAGLPVRAHGGAPVRRPGRGPGRVPALELPPRAGVHRHHRGLRRGLRPGRAVHPRVRPRSRSPCWSWACPSSTRSGSSSGGCLSGRSPFTPDRGHIHHRLLDLGLTHRRAVLLIYGICVVLAVLSIVLAGGPDRSTRSWPSSSPSAWGSSW